MQGLALYVFAAIWPTTGWTDFVTGPCLSRDTAGQERYASLAPLYYRGASAAAVVYDITNDDTFAKAKHWVSELQKNAGGNLGMMALRQTCCICEFDAGWAVVYCTCQHQSILWTRQSQMLQTNFNFRNVFDCPSSQKSQYWACLELVALAVVVLVGNKTDLEEHRVISEEEGREYATG